MEKKKPHYTLSEVQRVVEERGINAFTATALNGVVALGLSYEQAVVVVLGLKQRDLYIKYDHEWRSQNLAGRVSRDTEDRLGGLHQVHVA